MQNMHKHLELIQGVISRMAANSFQLKAWSVSLAGLLTVLADPTKQGHVVFLVYLPLAIFWGLDGYFLCQERLFRALYDHVRVKNDSAIDFSMKTTDFRKNEGCNWPASTLSTTLIPFYASLLVTILIVVLLTQPAKP
ncbi:MAG: hypothetical protein AAF628_26840 [Planctomycetota bacterium]